MEKEIYWSGFAKDFDEKQNYAAGKYVNVRVKAKLKSQKNLGKVLEFACGNGAFTKCIIDQATSIVATDYSEEMIEVSKKIFKNNDKVRVEQVNCHNSPYEDESFDTILMANLIHIIDNPKNVLKECYRLLKPHGLLLITCFTTDGMTIFNKLIMLCRYIKVFKSFPKSIIPFKLKNLSDFITNNDFNVEEAILLGKTTKAIFLKAVKAKSKK
ncbi:MAG: class I SAM-dependent methyltransferase [Spirochaetes bacterium]|nr:class I SAM-dependent methyltransferase [Spirochaetota bacterium]